MSLPLHLDGLLLGRNGYPHLRSDRNGFAEKTSGFLVSSVQGQNGYLDLGFVGRGFGCVYSVQWHNGYLNLGCGRNGYVEKTSEFVVLSVQRQHVHLNLGLVGISVEGQNGYVNLGCG